MSTTPNLLIALVASSQNNKEITVNSGTVQIDEALCANESIAVPDADVNLTTAEFLFNIFLNFTGNLTANRNIILPTGSARLIAVMNSTSTSGGSVGRYSLTFKVGTDSLVYVTTDENPHLIYSDGVGNVYKVS